MASTSEENKVPEDIKLESLIVDICCHPKNDVIAVGTIDGVVYVWTYSAEYKNHQILDFNHHKKACRAVAFSVDGKQLYSVSKDKSLHIVDLETGTLSQKISKAHKDPIYCLEVVDEYLVATGDDEGTVKVWDVRRENAILDMKQMEQYVSSLKIGNDKRILIATSGEGSLTAFNIRARRMELQSEPFSVELLCSTIVKEGRKVVVGGGDGALNIFNWGEWGAISDRFPGHPSSVDCMITATESMICTGSADGIIRAVSILPNRFVGVVGQHDDFPVEDLAITRDSQLLASCSHDQTIKFWNIHFLQTLKVSDKKKAKKKTGKQPLPSSREHGFFSDLAPDET